MEELRRTALGVGFIGVFFALIIYPDLEYTGAGTGHSCTGECYKEYVALNGTASEIEAKKREIANADEFSSIRSLWAGCAACHGQQGQGMGVFPALAGQSSEYITDRLVAYKNREEVGSMSSTMWAQAGLLSSQDMKTIGDFIQAGLPE